MLVSAAVEKSKEDFETTRYGLWKLEGASGRFGYCCLKECYHYQQICSLKNNHSKCTCASLLHFGQTWIEIKMTVIGAASSGVCLLKMSPSSLFGVMSKVLLHIYI